MALNILLNKRAQVGESTQHKEPLGNVANDERCPEGVLAEPPLTTVEQAEWDAIQAWVRPRRYSTARHDALIAALVGEGAKTAGFRPALLTATEIDCPALYPDAFRVDDEEQEVTAYEVEVTHGLTDAKLARYLRLAWSLDAIDWELRIVLVNRFGHRERTRLVRPAEGVARGLAPVSCPPRVQQPEQRGLELGGHGAPG